MNAMEILRSYTIMNGVLAASLLLFVSLRRLFATARITVNHRQLIKVGQVLILLSIICPTLTRTVPKGALSRLDWNPAVEVGRAFYKRSRYATSEEAKSVQTRYVKQSTPTVAKRVRQWMKAHAHSQSVDILLVLLAIGVLASLLRLLKNLRTLHAVVFAATPIRRIGSVVIAISETTTIPFSTRLGRNAVVILPSKILSNGNDFRVALRHELQHHRQDDTSWAVLVEFLISFFFLNPAMALWKREITELQEFSCDEALIGRKGISPHEYGSCLLRVAEAALGTRPMYAGTTCLAAVSKNPAYLKSFLRRRVEMFTEHRDLPTQRWAGITIGTLAAILTVVTAFGAEQALWSDNQSKVNSGEVVVDPAIQKIAESVLAKFVASEKAKAGFAIVAQPLTGKILAVANIDTTKSHSGYWILGEAFEPASVLKGLVVAEAVDKGLVSPQEKIACENGSYQYGDRVYHDWKKNGWDFLTVTDTIAYSSDICSIKIGEKLGSQGLVAMLTDFGFGPGGTASTFPSAKPGRLPPQDDPEHPRIVPYVSEGQDLDVTPIEMVQAYGAVINGGTLMAPKSANISDSEAQVIRRVLSPETSEKMKQILQQVVLKGTATQHGQSDLYTTGGKTATSYYPRHMAFDGQADFASFIGFAPIKTPQIEIYVGMRDPQSGDGAHGASHAAPVFREIVDQALSYLKVAPDKP